MVLMMGAITSICSSSLEYSFDLSWKALLRSFALKDDYLPMPKYHSIINSFESLYIHVPNLPKQI
jgi:hypothetical protein